MATEYKPDLREAVDTLINGPVEARLSVVQLVESGIAARIKNWAATPFRRWLIGKPDLQEPQAPPAKLESPIRGMTAGRRIELRKEAYEIFDKILTRAEIVDPDNSDYEYTSFDLNTTDGNVTWMNVKRGTQLEDHACINVDLTQLDLGRTYRAQVILEKSQAPEVGRDWYLGQDDGTPELKPYSPTEDAIALIKSGRSAEQRQWTWIVDDDLEHLFPERLTPK